MIRIAKNTGVKVAEVITFLFGCVLAAVLLLGVEIAFALKKTL